MSLAAFWSGVTEAQATIIAAGLTIVAAVTGVGLGAWLFGGRVKDLEGALGQSEQLLIEHKTQVDATLDSIAGRLGELDEQFTGIQEALGQLRGSVNVIENAATSTEGTEAQANRREALREQWASIRDTLEQIAADPEIDGRTRAKYGRIDRRRYADLIESLDNDGQLGNQADLYLEAVTLWHKHRNGRRVPTNADAQRMQELCAQLVEA